MKRFVAVLCGILASPAFAEVAPIYYDEVIEYTDEDVVSDDAASVTESATVVIPPPNRAVFLYQNSLCKKYVKLKLYTNQLKPACMQ